MTNHLLPQQITEQKRRIAPVSTQLNAIAGGATFFVSVVVAFFVTPQLVRGLGDARYGIMSLAGELLRYYGLLDLGVRSAVSYYVARLVVQEPDGELDELLRTAFWNLSALACGLLVLVAVGIWQLPVLVRVGNVPLSEARMAVGITLAAFALTLPLSVPNAVFVGCRRMDIASACTIAAEIATAVASVVAIRAGVGLVGISAILSSRVVLIWAAQTLCLRYIGFRIALWPPQLKSKFTRGIYSFGSANLLLTIAELIGYSMDLVVISRVIGLVAVSRFQIGRYLGMHAANFVGTMGTSLPAPFTQYTTQGNMDAARYLYRQASRLITALATLIACGIFVFGKFFLVLWVGQKYVTGDWWSRSDVVLVFAAIASLQRVSAAAYQYLLGTRRLRYLTSIRSVEALTNLSGSIVAAILLGPVGVAISKAVVANVAGAFMVRRALCDLDIRARDFWRDVALPAVATGAGTAGVGYAVTHFHEPTRWAMFGAEVALAGAVGSAALWTFALDPEQRARYIGMARAVTARIRP